MKKIAIVSCYFQKNYGSALQALATQKILDELNIENVTIRYDGLEKKIKKQKYKYYIKQLLNPEIVLGKIGYVKVRIQKKLGITKLGKNFRLRDNTIKKFENNFRLSPQFDSFSDLANYVKDFDAVIVGSDQLWLPSNLDANYYTLNWVPNGVKRISYATSFGLSSIPKNYWEFVAEFINKLDYVSVREESGRMIIKQICNRDATVICDPTLMFTGEEWKSIQKASPIYKKKYIFCYFLGDNLEQREFVKKLKAEMGYDIVAILHLNVYVASDEYYADATPYDVDSADFLNYIRYAEYVCTDSFHATVFSILNHKKFFTFRRFKENYALQTNSRLDSLLGSFNMKNRMLTGKENPQQVLADDIDYCEIDNIINELKAENMRFLKNALGIGE